MPDILRYACFSTFSTIHTSATTHRARAFFLLQAHYLSPSSRKPASHACLKDTLRMAANMDFKWLQEVEIKDGRVCVLDFLSLHVADLYTLTMYTEIPHLVI